VNKLDFDAINLAIDARRRVPEWAPGGTWRGDEYTPPNPTRADRNPGSFTINVAKGVWKDYATGDGGSDMVSLYAYIFHNNDQGAAAKELAESHGVKLGDPVTRERAAQVVKLDPPKPEVIFPVPVGVDAPTFKHPNYGEPSAKWEYRDKDGRLLMYVCRFDPPGERKQVIPRSWCKHPPKEDGGAWLERWTWRGITGSTKRPLYGLDRLQQDAEADAIVVEGEKTADAAQRLFGERAVCVTWMGGVETADRVRLTALAGRRVVLWPDFDAQRVKLTKEESEAGVDPASKPLLPLHEQPGVRAMMQLATSLKGLAREIIMVGYTIDPERGGWDLADAEAEGWDFTRVDEHLKANAGDPWHIAAARAPAPAPTPAPKAEQPPAASPAGSAPPAPPPAPPADNDNTPRLPLDASVNPFGFPHMGDKGQPLNTVENLAYMLGEYGITAQYNEVRKLTRVAIPGITYSPDNEANCVLAEITSMAARNRMPQSMLADYLKLIADRNAYNPVKEWISSKPWDGTSRLQQLYDTLTVAGDRGITDKLIFRWLVSAVAAVFMPHGFESHGVLVFTGPQGQGKTKWVKRLVPQELLDVVLVGAVLDPNNKDTVTNAISHWLVELGELDATFRKADIARLKAFITMAMDKVRRPYDRVETVYQRRTVFFASVNEDRYLVDDTGNRRWWTVPVVTINYAHTIDVQQLWAEVLELWRAGEQHWLTDEEFKALNALNAEHENVDPVEEMIQGAFDWNQLKGMGGRDMTASDVLILIGFDKPSKAQATHCSKVLKKLTGGDPRRGTGGQRFFRMPPAYKRRLNDGGGGFTHADEDRPF
jgi:hypothetical protein